MNSSFTSFQFVVYKTTNSHELETNKNINSSFTSFQFVVVYKTTNSHELETNKIV